FTHGNHIWMGAGQSPDDVELMAHESTHVLQQRSQRTPILQRNPQEYEHPEDGATVQKNMAAEVAKGTEGHEDEEPPAITPEQRAVQKGELVPHSKPPADRPAQARPRTAESASDVKTEVAQPAEPIAEGAEQSPQGKGEATIAADKAAGAAAAAASAAAPTTPPTPPPVVPPMPVLPINLEGENVQPDPTADNAAVVLAGEVQRMRNEGLVARQRAAAMHANASRLSGNIGIARAATDTAEQGLTSAHGHVETRRQIAGQARNALSVAEEKASTVASEAPEYAQRASATHDDSGPMASG